MIILLLPAGIILLSLIGIVSYLQFTEYQPATVEAVVPTGNGKPLPAGKADFTFVSWNIGYAGLGKEMDFFYDGGKTVRPGEEYSRNNFSGICGVLKKLDTADFVMIQEIDVHSKRTYFHNQLEEMNRLFPGHASIYATNYRVGFIPLPFRDPIGRVDAGLATYSAYSPDNCERHAYDAYFYWPKRLMFLKRCFIASYYSLGIDRQLVVVNLHNSAFDESGELRKKELSQLQSFLLREYQKGNYVIAGGDWNMNPPGFDQSLISTGDKTFADGFKLQEPLMPGWQVVYDPLVPSERMTDEAYRKGETPVTVIDFFITSPNITVISRHTLDLGFANSDHNPVLVSIRLNNE